MKAPRLRAHVGLAYPDAELMKIIDSGVRVHNVWVEADLDDEWTCAYRLLEQDGQIVVGELRIFPIETRQPGGEVYAAGEWSAKRLGVEARAPVGGLTARKTREVRFDQARSFLAAALRQVSERIEGSEETGELLEPYRVYREGTKPGRPGKPSSPLLDLAELSARYVETVQSGVRDPILELSIAVHYQPATVRWKLRKARAEGLLSPTLRGRPGGVLTDKARALLADG